VTVLLRTERDGRVFEVRAAGNTRRLYVDGVLHTSHNPTRALTGSVWDPLALAAFLAPPDTVKDCLVLGVGGGAAVHLLRRHVHPERITGIEYDRRILDLARKWFDLKGRDLELIEADAIAWVKTAERHKYHLVVDDLFEELDGEPVRHDSAQSATWWRRLERLIAPDGVLVVNFAWESDVSSSALCQDIRFRESFAAAFRFTFPSYENCVVALCRRPVSLSTFRRRLAAHPELGTAAARKLANFRVGRLWPS
jgi:spermidine synthase